MSNRAIIAGRRRRDGSRSRDEIRALEVLELEVDAEFEEVKGAWRRLAKANHPDVRPGDEAAAERFRAVQAAYDVLRQRGRGRRAAEPPLSERDGTGLPARMSLRTEWKDFFTITALSVAIDGRPARHDTVRLLAADA